MSNKVIEMADIKLAEGRTEADLMHASQRFQSEFLSEQPGFVARELVRKSDGSYADIVWWDNEETAMAVMQKAESSEACRAYFSVMEMNPENPAEGVAHFSVLAGYAAGS